MFFSTAQIKHILNKAESAYTHNKIASSRKREYLSTLKSYITKGGIVEDVCPECLGTGKAIQNWENS